jgi:hypothetical protein
MLKLFFKPRWIMICPNQIAFTVALALIERSGDRSMKLIIYNKSRSQARPFRIGKLFFIDQEQKRSIRVLVALFRAIGGFELFAPHQKFYGFLVRLFGKAAKVSLLDDGLDTLREVSQNIAPDDFEFGSAFYALTYDVPLGAWLNAFQVHPLASVRWLANSEQPVMDLSAFKTLVVESPPLSKVSAALGLNDPSTLLVQHSNVNKRVLNDHACPAVNGIDFPLEKSLSTFSGHLVVGESMVAVFAAEQAQPLYRVTVYLDQSRETLLRPLILLLRSRSWVTVLLC